MPKVISKSKPKPTTTTCEIQRAANGFIISKDRYATNELRIICTKLEDVQKGIAKIFKK